MTRFFSTSIVRQVVAITLALLVVSTAAIVAVTYYNLSRYVMESAVSDAEARAARWRCSMAQRTRARPST